MPILGIVLNRQCCLSSGPRVSKLCNFKIKISMIIYTAIGITPFSNQKLDEFVLTNAIGG